MSGKTKIAICGLGYVGLPLAIRFAESGVKVIGLDIDESKVKSLNEGKSYIKHIESETLAACVRDGSFKASTDFTLISDVEAILICVPTPLGHHREPDISFVLNTGKAIAPYLAVCEGQKTKLVILESTTYPGTTDEDLRSVLEEGSGLIAGKDFHLAYSPEREDPGRKDHSVRTIPKVMGGLTPECLERCKELYLMALDKVHPVSSTRVAEATKLMENIFRAVNIALVNELKMVYHEMGIDVWEVIEAASTKPFGYMPFYPGPGLGGHCIPIDPFYLTWKAHEFGMHTRFIELAGEINTHMPEYVVSRIFEALNDRSKAVKGAKILILGIAYKKNIDDDRESPSYKIWRLLDELGAIVHYNDPFVSTIRLTREYPEYNGFKSTEIVAPYDAIVIATDHDKYKEIDFGNLDCPVIDTRNLAVGYNVYRS